MMAFKDRVKQLREESNLSYSQLAAEVGKSEGAIRSWETERSKPDIDTLIKLAHYFDCSTDYLLGFNDDKNASARDERVLAESHFSNVMDLLPEHARNAFLDIFISFTSSYQTLLATQKNHLADLLIQYLNTFAHFVEITMDVIHRLTMYMPEDQSTKDIVLSKYYRESNQCVYIFNELSQTITNILNEIPIAAKGDPNAKT